MKKTCFLLLSFELFFALCSQAAVEQKISFSSRADLVLSTQSRKVVLNVVEAYLGEKDGDFIERIASISNPYVFFQPAKEVPSAVVTTSVGTTQPQARVNVQYDDASVLKAVGSNFSKQVRGTLARGTTSYIQLQGGGLLKPGATFSARLPGVKDQSYKLTLEAINSDGYTLRLGDATLTLPYDAASSRPGAIKLKGQ